jgi:hypothetical protein
MRIRRSGVSIDHPGRVLAPRTIKLNRWQAQQVGAEALPGLAGGLVAALFVELPLILRLFVMTAALVLKFEVSQQTHDSLP